MVSRSTRPSDVAYCTASIELAVVQIAEREMIVEQKEQDKL